MPKKLTSCSVCQSDLYRWPSEVGDRVFCSTTCRGRSRTEEALRRRIWDIDQPSTHKLIPLTKGKFAKVSNEDYGTLSKSAWYMDNALYAGRWAGQPRSMHVHIFKNLMGQELPPGHIVDHINRDHLDNRRENLRAATQSQNTMNSVLPITSSSRYRGVRREGNRWHSYIYFERKQYSIGWFASADEAAWMRDQWAIQLHGEFGILNFSYS